MKFLKLPLRGFVLFCLLVSPMSLSALEHRVTKGDTLYSIAKRYGVSVADIRGWNNLSSSGIKSGQVLRLGSAPSSRPTATAFHTVRKGETLWRIAYLNGLTVKELTDLNRNTDVGELKVGQKIRIPVPASRAVRERPEPRRSLGGRVKGLAINRPVRGVCEGYKKGVRIYCGRGTPAASVLPGDVEYVGTLVGYKNVVILRHKNEVYSVYAALDEILVRSGQNVRQGQSLGRVEKLSHYDRTFLYFELVSDGRNVDPEKHFKD